jgi:hypothetical protein
MVMGLMVLLAATAAVPSAGGPSQAASKAFDDYAAKLEAGIAREESAVGSFVFVASGASGAGERAAAVRRGEVVVEAGGAAMVQVPGGLIHHWVGTIFIPSASVSQVLGVVQDYDHLARYYSPEVVSSRLISREGDDFRIALRMRESKVVTVVMDSEFEVRYGQLDAAHQFSFSRSTRIAEIADAGGAHERTVVDAENHGYLWRLNSYWRFVERGDGVLVQCEAISLTRDIPVGFGWLVGPLVRAIPRDSLEATLGATRDAVEWRLRMESAKK